MTIKEYASSRGVSYETVRRQVAAAKKKALKGHLNYQGKQAFLDDFAIDYLDQHRQPRNVVVAANNEDIQKELERLHNQVHQLQTELYKKSEEMNAMYKEQTKLLEEKAHTNGLLMLADKEHAELEEAKKELAQYRHTIFGLYRKIES